MKIEFDKVGHSSKSFHKKIDDVSIDGSLQKLGHHRVALEGDMRGHVAVKCDRCGVSYDYRVEQQLNLTLSNQIVESKDDLDIIEFLDGKIDISFILQSEINTIKSEYHYCDDCQDSEDELEIEF